MFNEVLLGEVTGALEGSRSLFSHLKTGAVWQTLSHSSFFLVTEPRLYSRTEVGVGVGGKGCFLEPPEGECGTDKASQKNCIFFSQGWLGMGL